MRPLRAGQLSPRPFIVGLPSRPHRPVHVLVTRLGGGGPHPPRVGVDALEDLTRAGVDPLAANEHLILADLVGLWGLDQLALHLPLLLQRAPSPSPVRSGFAATHTPKPTAVCHIIGRVLRLVPRLPCAEAALCRGCLVPRLTRASNLLVLKTLFEISDLRQPYKGRELPKRQQPIFRNRNRSAVGADSSESFPHGTSSCEHCT